MKKLFIFTISLIQELITNNLKKLIFIIFGLACLYLSNVFDKDEVITEKVINQFSVDNKYVYVYVNNNGYHFKEFNKKMIIKNGILTYKETDSLYSLFMAGFIIVSLLTVFMFFMGLNDHEIGWEFEDCWETAFGTLISCEIQDSKYHYIIFDRLVSIEDRQVNSRNISSYFYLTSFKQILNLPKFETTSGRRDSLLKKLGI
jgi:hypothetical protein